MPELSQETIKRLTRRYFEQLLSSTEELAYLIPTDPAVDQAYEAQDSLDEAERLKTSLAERRYDAITKGAAVEVLHGRLFRLKSSISSARPSRERE